MTQFKIGDRVRVVNVNDENEYKQFMNETGTISDIDEMRSYPYSIEFDNKDLNDYELSDITLWRDEALEPVNEKGKIQVRGERRR